MAGVDFAAMLREMEAERRDPAYVPSGTRVTGPWPPQGVAMRVRRGSFIIPADLFDEGREHDLARNFAQSIPDDAEAGRREKLAGGAVRMHWRIITVVAA